jgi:O-antigen/teichoic acid export membrane protein
MVIAAMTRGVLVVSSERLDGQGVVQLKRKTARSWFARFRLRQGVTALLRSDFVLHGAIVFVALMIVNACNYGFHFFAGHRLGPATYGVLASLIAGINLATIFGSILNTIVVKYAAEFQSLEDWAKLRALSNAIARVTFVLAAIMVTLSVLLRNVIAAFFHSTDGQAVVIAGFIVALTLMTPAYRGILQGVQNFGGLAGSIIIEGLGKCVLGVALVYWTGSAGLSLLGWACGLAVGLAYAMHACRSHWRESATLLFLDVRRLVKTTGGVAVATVSIVFLGSVDLLLVKHYFPAYDAGLYSAAALAGKVLLFAVSFIPTLILPKAANIAARGQAATGVLMQSLGAGLCISVCGLIFTYIFPLFIVHVIAGPAFSAAAPYLFPYGCAMSLLAAMQTVVTYKMGLHQFDFSVPLIAACALQIAGIAFFHHTITEVLWVLIAANVVAFIGSLRNVRGNGKTIRIV